MQIPYHKQEKFYSCGPACLRMVLEYLGEKFEEEELIKLCGTTILGTDRFQILEVAENLKFHRETFCGLTLEEVKKILKDGIPIIALIDPTKI